MAEEGKGYVEILQHYYTGVTVEECPGGVSPPIEPNQAPGRGIPCGRAFLWEKGCALGRIGCKIASIKTFRGGVSGEMWRRRPLMIRVLLWDVDNTLLDFPAAERRAPAGDLRPVPPGPLPRGSGGTVRRPERQLLAPAGAGRDYQSPAASRPVSGVFPAGGHCLHRLRPGQRRLPVSPGGHGGLPGPEL